MDEIRLIDAYALIKNICDECVNQGTHCDQTDCLWYTERNRIESAPTVDAKPVRRGRWIKIEKDGKTLYSVCSECGAVMNLPWYWYCGKCGAEMFGGAENDER